MEEVNLVVESLKFMVLGMGIVFLFLTVMIFALKIQAKIIEKLFPVEVKKDISSSSWKPEVKKEDDKDTIAAITAAIIHHNNKNKG